MSKTTERAIARLVRLERARQDAKWGEQNHPDGTGPGTYPLLELLAHDRHPEAGQTAAVLRDRATSSTDGAAVMRAVTWRHILLEEVLEALAEDDPAVLFSELIQVSAVCQQWAGALVRRGLPDSVLPNDPVRQFTGAHLGIVYLLAEHQGLTHNRLRRYWEAKAARVKNPWPWISDSGLRTRCSELVAWGLVEDTGARGSSPTGRSAAIWTLAADPRLVGRDALPVPGVDASAVERLEALLNEAGSDVLIRSQLELAADVAGIRRAAARRDASDDVANLSPEP